MSDERIQAALCRWAEAKYGLGHVTRVAFDIGAHGPYSDVTPDVDPYIAVYVHVEHESQPRRFEGEVYGTGLINDIVGFLLL